RAQILLWQTVRVRTQVTRMGNKSLRFDFLVENAETGELFASAETIMVTYDYQQHQSVPIWDEWREMIAVYEGIPVRET
ncbi:MAG TPA: thioesterase family protein, partial [Candidatus Methylomirabilis sp.]|nr:thioesterase family protein [Candidatus Methylomirabilis sp.]